MVNISHNPQPVIIIKQTSSDYIFRESITLLFLRLRKVLNQGKKKVASVEVDGFQTADGLVYVDNENSGDSLNGCCYFALQAHTFLHSQENAEDCPEDLNK